MDVLHGRVELAEFVGSRGSSTESFARHTRELRHGNEVLAATVLGYDQAKRFGQSQHTLENIWHALDSLFVSPLAVRRARRAFAGYLVLDAIVGNTDRHHENWGLLIRRTGLNFRVRIAPSFDHASSLGRELSDEQRKRRLDEERVEDYTKVRDAGLMLGRFVVLPSRSAGGVGGGPLGVTGALAGLRLPLPLARKRPPTRPPPQAGEGFVGGNRHRFQSMIVGITPKGRVAASTGRRPRDALRALSNSFGAPHETTRPCLGRSCTGRLQLRPQQCGE